jgi:hypothetical protein
MRRNLSVIVDDRYVVGTIVDPFEDDAPLVIDPDGVGRQMPGPTL